MYEHYRFFYTKLRIESVKVPVRSRKSHSTTFSFIIYMELTRVFPGIRIAPLLSLAGRKSRPSGNKEIK